MKKKLNKVERNFDDGFKFSTSNFRLPTGSLDSLFPYFSAPTMYANVRLFANTAHFFDNDDTFNQLLSIHISASKGLIDEPKKKNFIRT